jgi:hypothetical protein
LDDLKSAVQTLGPEKATAMNLRALDLGAGQAALTPYPAPVRNKAELERPE